MEGSEPGAGKAVGMSGTIDVVEDVVEDVVVAEDAGTVTVDVMVTAS